MSREDEVELDKLVTKKTSVAAGKVRARGVVQATRVVFCSLKLAFERLRFEHATPGLKEVLAKVEASLIGGGSLTLELGAFEAPRQPEVARSRLAAVREKMPGHGPPALPDVCQARRHRIVQDLTVPPEAEVL